MSGAICYDLRFPDFLRGVRFALSLRPEAEMMTVEQNPTLRREVHGTDQGTNPDSPRDYTFRR